VWEKTGDIRWVVESLNRNHKLVTIYGELLGRPQRHMVPLRELTSFRESIEVNAAPAPAENVEAGKELASCDNEGADERYGRDSATERSAGPLHGSSIGSCSPPGASIATSGLSPIAHRGVKSAIACVESCSRTGSWFGAIIARQGRPMSICASASASDSTS
jgi:hypothetical protein